MEAIDVKGDLPNLLLTFPNFDPGHLQPWIEAGGDADSVMNVEQAQRCEERKIALGEAGISEAELRNFCQTTSIRVITPGATAGESLHVLSALEWERS